jgi:hypothetical protein
MIATSVDCPGSFASALGGAIDQAAPGGKCSSTSDDQKGPYMRLFRRTLAGPREVGTFDAAHGVVRLGGYALRVSCSRQEESLIVRAAKMDASGKFGKDPLTGGTMDFGARRALVIGGAARPACFPVRRSPQSHTFDAQLQPAGKWKKGLAAMWDPAYWAQPWQDVTWQVSSAPRNAAGFVQYRASQGTIVHLSVDGNSSWGGNVYELPYLGIRIHHRIDGGAWQTAYAAGRAVHNAGSDFSFGIAVFMNASELLEANLEVMHTQPDTYLYTPTQSGANAPVYIAAWSTVGMLSLSADE